MIDYSKDLSSETAQILMQQSILYEYREKYQILDKVETLTKTDKVFIGVMEKINSRQVSITVKSLLKANQFAKRSTLINEQIGKWLIKKTHSTYQSSEPLQHCKTNSTRVLQNQLKGFDNLRMPRTFVWKLSVGMHIFLCWHTLTNFFLFF